MNKAPKVHPTMTSVDKETEDKVMTEVATLVAGTSTTKTSTCLTKKLKKPMQMTSTNGNMEDTMDVNKEEQQKGLVWWNLQLILLLWHHLHPLQQHPQT